MRFSLDHNILFASLSFILTHGVAGVMPVALEEATNLSLRAVIAQELKPPGHVIVVEKSGVEPQLTPAVFDQDRFPTDLECILSAKTKWNITFSTSALTLREPALANAFTFDLLGSKIDTFSSEGDDLNTLLRKLTKKTGVIVDLANTLNKLPITKIDMNLHDTTLREALSELTRLTGNDYLYVTYMYDKECPCMYVAHIYLAAFRSH